MARSPLMADLRRVVKQLKTAREHHMSLPEFREKNFLESGKRLWRYVFDDSRSS